MRALIVSNDDAAADGLSALLRSRGWSCDILGDGAEAAVSYSPELYDAAFVDFGLAGSMDGIATALQLKLLGRETPVVLLSDRPDRTEAARRSGFDLVLEKPITVGEVLDILPATRVPVPVRKKVVVIDDDSSFNEIVSAVLTRRGYEVSCALDGEDGLRRVRAERPALAVVDLMLPVKHGFDVCRELRTADFPKRLRVLVASAKRYDADVRAALSMGADRFLKKPFAPEDFLSVVREMIGESPAPN